MKIEEKSVFFFENNKSLLYFGEISFLEHYQKPTKGAKQNWALDQKSKVPAYWKTIKAQHENPLEYIYTYTYIQNSSNIFTKLHPVNQTGQISKKTRYPRETIIVATRTDPASKIGTRQMRNIYVTRKHTTVRITDERITRRYTIRVFRIYNTHRSSSSITSTMSIMTILIIRTLRCRKRCLHLLWLKNLLRSLLSWTEQY